MATLTVATTSVEAGGALQALVAAAGGGDDFANTGRELFMVDNGGGAPITVTFDSTLTSDLGQDVNPAETVTNATVRLFGPFNVKRYGDSLGITYSAVTSVTVQAIKLAEPTLVI